MVRFSISETNKDDLITPCFDDDGALEVRGATVTFDEFQGSINAGNIQDKIAFVSLYLVTQPITDSSFDMDEDFDLKLNRLIVRNRGDRIQTVSGSSL